MVSGALKLATERAVTDQRWWSSILLLVLGSGIPLSCKGGDLRCDRGHKGVKTLSLSFVTERHSQSVRALKMERFWQREVPEAEKTLNKISLVFSQTTEILGWVGGCMAMSNPPEISEGFVSPGGIFPRWSLCSPSEAG